ncbi:MAG: lyase family protein [bacterium]
MDHDVWQSPFSWRYGSPEMRALWSETARRRLWRRVWVALAETQADIGLVTAEQVADVRAQQDAIDLDAALEREARLHHDMMAELETYAAQCPVGGGILHLGATSMDVQDNADAVRLREALALVQAGLRRVLAGFARKINELADVPTLGFTHLQAAEPTTMGYRLAQYGQDLAADHAALSGVAAGLVGKGFKGAVGTAASYAQLLEGTGWTVARFEAGVMGRLGLPAAPVATQTAPRKQEYTLLCALAGLGQSVYRFAADLRLLQAPAWRSGPSPSAPTRWAPARCRSSATPSLPRTSTASPAPWPRCPASRGTTPP